VLSRSKRVAALVLAAAALASSIAPITPANVRIKIVWDMPRTPPPFDCDNQAYARNNPDKCGLPGPFLLGGGAPRGRGLLGGLLHGLTGGLL
jgi:hypothetical protein